LISFTTTDGAECLLHLTLYFLHPVQGLEHRIEIRQIDLGD